MKTLITTIAIGFLALNADASHFGSALNLKLNEPGKCFVTIDKRSVASKAGFASFSDLEPGNHKLKVEKLMPQPYGYPPVVMVIYKGWINMPLKSVVYARITHKHQLSIDKVEPYFYPPADNGCGNEWIDDDCGMNNGCGMDDGWGYQGWNGPGNGYGYHAMSPADFNMLLNTIAGKSFESSKLQIAKQVLNTNFFSSKQVAAVMNEFSFETTKIEFAKTAYERVVDKQNFYLVNDVFAFESSIQTLNQYLGGH